MGEDITELIWYPRLSFFNVKSVEKLAGFGYSELRQFYLSDPKIQKNNMDMCELMKISISCYFDFNSFPFDHQECDFSLYDATNMIEWIILNETQDLCYEGMHCNEFGGNGIITLPDQPGIPYKIGMKYMGVLNYQYDSTWNNSTVAYSTIKFTFERNSLGLLIGSFYLPTGLFAVLSMVSYIISPDIVSRGNLDLSHSTLIS